MLERPAGPIDASSAAAAVAATLPEGAIVSDEGTTCGMYMLGATRRGPHHDWLNITGGAIGQGMPVATGAALACADRPVLNIQSDGSAMYTIQALWTQAREQLDVTTLLCNNGAYAILAMELDQVGAAAGGPVSRSLLDLGRPDLDFCRLAEGQGVPAVRVATAEELWRPARTGLPRARTPAHRSHVRDLRRRTGPRQTATGPSTPNRPGRTAAGPSTPNRTAAGSSTPDRTAADGSFGGWTWAVRGGSLRPPKGDGAPSMSPITTTRTGPRLRCPATGRKAWPAPRDRTSPVRSRCCTGAASRVPADAAAAPENETGATRWWLRIEGLAQQGDIWLDGTYLGHTDGYFVPHELEVTEQIGRA